MSTKKEFSIIGNAPTQSFGNNKGIFSPNDVKFLQDENKFTSFGQLEHIQTQTGTTVTEIIFSNIKQDIYNVHLLVMNNIGTASDNVNPFVIRMQERGGSYYTTQYKTTFYRARTNGTFTEYRSNNTTYVYMNQNNGNATNEKTNGFLYCYNCLLYTSPSPRD